MSQPMRRTFDIKKAEEIRRRTDPPITYAEIARQMGLQSRQAVGHWFRGRGEPNVQQLKQMAGVLGCHWLELVKDDTVVVYREEERQRINMIRELAPDALAELDAFLRFKTTTKDGK